MPQNNEIDSSYDMLVFMLLFVAVLGGIYYLYIHYPFYFNLVFMKINQPFLYAFSFLPFGQAKELYSLVDWNDPGYYRFSQIRKITDVTGYYLRWIIIPFICFLIYRSETVLGRAELFTAIHSMQSLMQQNVKRFPCLAPVAWREIINEPLDSGPWRLSRTPLQFAAENKVILKDNKPVSHELLINKKTGLANERSSILKGNNNQGNYLDYKKIEKLFSHQLGNKFISPFELTDYQKGLAAALFAFASHDSETGQKFLDQMSLSFEEKTDKTPLKIDISGADELLEKYINDESTRDDLIIEQLKKYETFVNSWFMALLSLARNNGVICASQFIWLKPTDRTLFYALNHLPSSSIDDPERSAEGWIEAASVLAHYNATSILEAPIFKFQMMPVIRGLEDELISTGWLPKK